MSTTKFGNNMAIWNVIIMIVQSTRLSNFYEKITDKQTTLPNIAEN